MKPLADRLWSHVDRSAVDGCWPFTGATQPFGYGIIGVGSRLAGSMLAHRAAFTVTNGPIPPGMCVLHACDNPPCCRPDHLFLGTHADNMADMATKGRAGVLPSEQYPRAVLTAKQVEEIRSRRHPGEQHRTGSGLTVRELAAEYGVTHPEIVRIVNGERWEVASI